MAPQAVLYAAHLLPLAVLWMATVLEWIPVLQYTPEVLQPAVTFVSFLGYCSVLEEQKGHGLCRCIQRNSISKTSILPIYGLRETYIFHQSVFRLRSWPSSSSGLVFVLLLLAVVLDLHSLLCEPLWLRLCRVNSLLCVIVMLHKVVEYNEYEYNVFIDWGYAYDYCDLNC